VYHQAPQVFLSKTQGMSGMHRFRRADSTPLGRSNSGTSAGTPVTAGGAGRAEGGPSQNGGGGLVDLLGGLDDPAPAPAAAAASTATAAPPLATGPPLDPHREVGLEDLLGVLGTLSTSAPQPQPQAQHARPQPAGTSSDPPVVGLDDLLGGLDVGGPAAAPTPSARPAPVAVGRGGPETPSSSGAVNGPKFSRVFSRFSSTPVRMRIKTSEVLNEGGVTVSACMQPGGSHGSCSYVLLVRNDSAEPLHGLMVKFNSNTFGLAPADPRIQETFATAIAPGTSRSLSLSCRVGAGPPAAGDPSTALQVALKCSNMPVKYWHDRVDPRALLSPEGALAREAFLAQWRSIPEAQEIRLAPVPAVDVSRAAESLGRSNVFFMARPPPKPDGRELVYASAVLGAFKDAPILVEVGFKVPGAPPGTAVVSVRCVRPELARLVAPAIGVALAP